VEGELETMLDDTEYDSQLGMDMARDAMRVTRANSPKPTSTRSITRT